MHKARAFFYVCAGIFLLALAYHLGARTATAQVGSSNPVVAVESGNVYTANGDVYTPTSSFPTPQYVHCCNVFTGPTPAAQPTWGQLKSRYRPGAAAAPQDK